METLGLIVIIALIIGVFAAVKLFESQRRAVRRKALLDEAKAYVAVLQYEKRLAPVGTQVLLKNGETAYYFGSGDLYEPRAVRHYESGSAGFRVAKGVYVGRTKGRSVTTQEWTTVDRGSVTVTNRRLIFHGGKEDRSIALDTILALNPGPNHLEISCEKRAKAMAMSADNPLILALVIRICRDVPNPSDLAEHQLNVTFDS